MPDTGTPKRPSEVPALATWAALVAVVASAGFVFWGSLGYFFSQDDFAALARARGLREALPGLWRWLSGTAYFALMRPLGLDATAYHAVNLAAHTACAAALFLLLKRRFSVPASLLGALFFVAHPALYTAVYWISTSNDIFALLFALASIACAARPGAVSWVSLPLFALSLLSKETTLFLPAVLWFSPGWLDDPGPPAAAAAGTRVGRARIRIGLAAIAAIYFAYWHWSDVAGTRAHPEGSSPYAMGAGRHVLDNAITYLGWTVSMLLPTTRGFEDMAEPSLWPWAACAAALWVAGGFSARLRASGWLSGGATFVFLLLPVLGLRNHTYHYYLYAPLIGASWCAAALVDAWPRPAPQAAAGRRRPERVAAAPASHPASPLVWPTVLVAGAFLVLNGALLVRKIEHMPFVDERLRADPIVDRARIARRVYDGLRAARIPRGTRLVFWSPSSMRYERRIHPDADVIGKETYWERNVRAALQDGLAVRVMFPQVDSVAFLHAYRAAGADTRFVLYDPDGTVSVATPAHVDSMLRAQAAP
jgi:hypothetical protein